MGSDGIALSQIQSEGSGSKTALSFHFAAIPATKLTLGYVSAEMRQNEVLNPNQDPQLPYVVSGK